MKTEYRISKMSTSWEMWRWKNKNGVEDLDKAEWYLNKSDELNSVF